jgi:hypothetical protein
MGLPHPAMLVSYFPDSLNPKSLEALPLPELLAGVRDGRWAEQVQAVRALEPGSAAYNKAKKLLPSFTVSGSFQQRNAAGLLQHSGLLCLDIDGKANPDVDLNTVRQLVEADSYTYTCFFSVGGRGLAIVVPVPEEDHKGSFRALAAHYQQAYGLTVDQACKDVSRLRYVSYDPALYLNEQAATFEETLPEQSRPITAPLPASRWRPSAQGEGYGQQALTLACDKVRAAPDGSKRTVLNKMAFLCGGYIGAGFLSEAEAQRALEATISTREVEDLPAAFKTITIGLRDGQHKPVLPEALQYHVRHQLREGMGVDGIVSTLAAAQGLPTHALEHAVRAIVTEQANEVAVLTFWEMVSSSTKHDSPLKPVLRTRLFRQFLTRHGFRKLLAGQKVRVVREIEQVVHEISRSELKDFVLDYLDSLPFEFDGTYRRHIEELVQVQHRMLFEEGSWEFLPTLAGNFQRDTPNQAFLFFRNAVVVATPDGPELRPYAELPGLVWAQQLIDRDFTLLSEAELEEGEFSTFLFNLAGRQPERMRALLLFLGYYLHSYKDPSNPRVGVLLDEGMGPDGQANGGTGKSLVFEALSHLLPVVTIDGRGYDPRNSKELQEVSDATRVVFFDDWAPALPFERLFTMATGTLTVDRHYLGKQSYPYAVSPKFGITTNGVLTGQGGSHDRRRFEVEIAPHYGAHNQPRDEFGHNFFSGWDAAEWARFDALMVHACCLFLQTGGRLVSPVSAGLEQRRLRAATSAGFVDFMDAQPRGVALSRAQLLNDFREAEGYDEKAFTPERFGKWLAFYKQLSTDFQTGQDWSKDVIGRRIVNRWIMLAKDVTDSV